MENDVTKETLKILAQANGLQLAEGRLERVLKQYQDYLRLIARLNNFELKREAEPETVFTLASEVPDESQPAHSRQTKGEPHGNR